ncbi:MAG TPA: hypothetical protein VGQ44_13735 [Gemmatimonadaceae bacterium]|jgi:hypothetical protein|nr:hypothetical protein [Gemmatimonadaceae bacterium]
MTAIAQVLHVARKDLRESRWPFVVFIAVVAAAGVRVAGKWAAAGVFGMSMFLVVLTALLVVAILVQSDSPIRADAFWTTRPLAPAAVLLAKVLVLAIVVGGVPLAAQAITVASFDVHGTALARHLSTSILEYGRWLLFGLALASMTKDLKTFVVALVGIPIAFGIGSDIWAMLFMRNSVSFDAGSASRGISLDQVITWIGTLGCIALPIWLYARRDQGWRTIAAGTLFVACGVVAALNTDSSPPTPPVVEGAPRENAITLSLSAQNQIRPGQIQLTVRATPARPDERITFRLDYADLELADGDKTQIQGQEVAELGATRPRSLGGAVWLSPNRDSTDAPSIVLVPQEWQKPLVAKGVKRITIHGRILAAMPRVAGILPTTVGARLATPGRRISLGSWREDSGIAQLTVHEIELPHSASDFYLQNRSGSRVLTYALVNDARHEALPLEAHGVSTGSTSLVLPGDEAYTTDLSLDTREAFPGRARPPLAEGWFQAARVWRIDWISAGSYPVRAELTLP